MLGGWWSETSPPTKQNCHWYSITVPRTEKLAFVEGSSQRRIAALELMGTLILLRISIDISPRGLTDITVPMATDNAGNSYGISAERFKKWPVSDTMMEMMITCQHTGTRLAVTREAGLQ